MDIDIIGSSLTKELTDFKNFPYKVKHIIENQSINSLFSKPFNIEMAELNTDDLAEITNAYRDLNKTHVKKLENDPAQNMMIDLTSELNDICEINGSFYNVSSVSLLSQPPEYWNLARIQKFRNLKLYLDKLVNLLGNYEKVILLKVSVHSKEDQEFLDSLYTLLQNKLDNLLAITLPELPENRNLFDAPLEYYNDINNMIRKLASNNYNDQLLFDEIHSDDHLSVFINYIESREYIYDIYKDGKPIFSSAPTTSRTFGFTFEQPGKYRIRVNPVNSNVEPRFSSTYDWPGKIDQLQKFNYIELPEKNNDWKIDILCYHYDILGLIGNPYKYPEGYNNIPVYLEAEVEQQDILYSSQITDQVLVMANDLDSISFKVIMDKFTGQSQDEPLVKYLYHLIENPEADV
ncbi:hypothetical protein FO441_00945 [Salinicoccus cyprini]|uniref:Uncharacterized protein n=1 Tax=Salinicoccus cyprini TaxID=2493691 RepID=A0A558AX93_9STAP|nr:hypothetical protein [Salinicoccus cyprini]TVT28878.1 hypothetical protein FO441_00945 [Salinicoccus cyprini]